MANIPVQDRFSGIPSVLQVHLKPETFLTLVQTDKAKYHPGQKVLFRVVSLSHDLTALNNDVSAATIAAQFPHALSADRLCLNV